MVLVCHASLTVTKWQTDNVTAGLEEKERERDGWFQFTTSLANTLNRAEPVPSALHVVLSPCYCRNLEQITQESFTGEDLVQSRI